MTGLRASLGAARKYIAEIQENILNSELESHIRLESLPRDTDHVRETTEFARARLIAEVGTRLLPAVMNHEKAILDLLA
ncbi:MAG: hypothetical protein LBU64_02690 [Planctomycetota bacterium]|nr:hypothetical protein [Planctomycetota bacterium]